MLDRPTSVLGRLAALLTAALLGGAVSSAWSATDSNLNSAATSMTSVRLDLPQWSLDRQQVVQPRMLPIPVAESADETHYPTVRVGVLAYSPPWYDGSFIHETIYFLGWRLPKHRFQLQFLKADELDQALRDGTLDIVAAPPTALLLYRESAFLRDLATIVSDTAPNPSFSSAAAVIVRRDRTDIEKLDDLKGKIVSTVPSEVTPGLLEVQYELLKRGYDPNHFFGKLVTQDPLRMRDVISDVLSGRADAGIVRACYLEDFRRSKSNGLTDAVKVLERRVGDGLSCGHSTALNPGWIIAATENLPQEVAREVTAELLTMPMNAWGQYWSIATDISTPAEMLRALQLGPYRHLKDWSIERFWEEYRTELIIALALIILMLGHGVILEARVRRRTSELERVHAAQRRLTEKLDALQRAGAVGQISSIVAHEMKQPLDVIQNLSRGTLRMIEDEPETLDDIASAVEGIHDQAGRAAAIIDRVRSYSQGRTERIPIELDSAVRRITAQFRASGKGRLAHIKLGPLDKAVAQMDPLDFELIVINLLSNAVDAASKSPKPAVTIGLFLENDVAHLTVSDNGPALTDEAFAALGTSILKTTKANGLGLGVNIVRTMAENYVGRLTYHQLKPSGIMAEVTIPAVAPEPTNTPEESQHG